MVTRGLFLGIFFFICISFVSAQNPITLHPKNPRYLFFKGKPVVLISSAEHYGAILNLDFNYVKYLDVLGQYGFNHTRAFSGMYCEGSEFDIENGKSFSWDEIQNPLSPRPDKFIAPWARSTTPGYVRSGNKFDLDTWDEAYFRRLKDFLTEANSRGVIVEMVLFTAFYSPTLWQSSPLHPSNNINGTEDIPFNEFHMQKHKKLFARQLDMVKKIVQEINEFDNVYFEICNEPYWLKGHPSSDSTVKEQQFLPEIDAWQREITRVITETERNLPKKHLVAQNIANSNYKMTSLDPAVSILNFHYAFPPDCIGDNYQFNKPIIFDETHDGVNAPNKRTEAWAFMLSGGAGYSNLDWSFTTDDPTGLGRNPLGRRRSGQEVRNQLKVLADVMNRFDFIHSKPISEKLIKNVPQGLLVYGIHIPDKEYMVYFLKQKTITYKKAVVDLPAGAYTVQFTDPLNGKSIKSEKINHMGGDATFSLPDFSDDVLLRFAKQ